MQSRPNIPSVRTITLPSGHKVELINFVEPPAPSPTAPQPSIEPLHICRRCGSCLIQPVDWRQEDDGCWAMSLRCPECQHLESGRFSEAEIESFEDVIDEALAAMIEDLQQLARANMIDDVERLISALVSDLILPEDF